MAEIHITFLQDNTEGVLSSACYVASLACHLYIAAGGCALSCGMFICM